MVMTASAGAAGEQYRDAGQVENTREKLVPDTAVFLTGGWR
jgi:hypothetical protein